MKDNNLNAASWRYVRDLISVISGRCVCRWISEVPMYALGYMRSLIVGVCLYQVCDE